jgi:hypothetical protein
MDTPTRPGITVESFGDESRPAGPPPAMRAMIAGAGIGGPTSALTLHRAGIEAEVFEQAAEVRELGVGITLLPHAVKALAGLGLLPALDREGIRTRRLIYMTRHGQSVWDEPRGTDAGYEVPQIGIHRGTLQGVLHQAALERLGAGRIHTGHRLIGFEERGQGVMACFERRADGARVEVTADTLIGADGIHSALRPLPYPQLQGLFDAAAPPGLHHYWRSGMFEALGEEVIDLIVAQADRAPSPRTSVQLDYYGGAAGRVGAQETAYPHREPLFGLVISAAWAGPDGTEANVAWAREMGGAVRAAGGERLYSNQMMGDEQDRIRDAYGVNYERLVVLKTRYDPTNLFRLNPNIAPAP